LVELPQGPGVSCALALVLQSERSAREKLLLLAALVAALKGRDKRLELLPLIQWIQGADCK
jgi:hypothetical protein